MRAGHRLLRTGAFLLSLLILLLFALHLYQSNRRERGERLYMEAVLRSAEEFDVPPALILAVIRTESDFSPRAVSRKGAAGLMQLLPQTFLYLRDTHLKESVAEEEIFTPAVNIRYGTFYLSYLHHRFGSWETVLAAYNAGEGRVLEWLRREDGSDQGHLTAIPFPETRQYVEKTLEAYRFYQDKYDLK